MDFKEEIVKALKREIKEEINLEIPPDPNLGDYAFPCFNLARIFKKNPNEISLELSKKIKSKYVTVEAKGPYLNFFVDKKILCEETIKNILHKKRLNPGKGKKAVIEMSSPNIAKPFGIGHLRSTIIGNSISNIYKELGYKTVKINYLGDWGTQFGKLIFGYKKFGNEKDLKKNAIKHLLEIYVKANKEEFEDEARDWFRKLEEGNKEALKLWKEFKELSLEEFKKIYKILNIRFDAVSGESYFNKGMGEILKELKKKKLLEESEGALIVNLEKYNLTNVIIQKKDGTTLYVTRDISAAIDRYKKYKFSRMVYEVGSEQKLHFSQLFKILELMGYEWAKNCTHVNHGLYLDQDGKKFSTRKGKVVFMEDILNETIELAEKTIKEKNPKLKDIKDTARKIGVAAIFYGDLKTHRVHDIVFDIEKFLDFDGNTGPYLLYSYVRANSILKNFKGKIKLKVNEINEKEFLLIKKMSEFDSILIKACEDADPSLIAKFSFEASKLFTDFYHNTKVIDSGREEFLIFLVQAFKEILGKSLELLGIETIEEM